MEKGASAEELLMDAFAGNGRIDLIPEGDGIEGMEIMAPANEVLSRACPYCGRFLLVLTAFKGVRVEADKETRQTRIWSLREYLCASCCRKSAKMLSDDGQVISFGYRKEAWNG
jgi:hypothetical protein